MATRDTSGGTGDGFVGRRAELAELSRALDRAMSGQGGLVWIGGEPGIGKSRLLDEVAERASDRGARVLVGRCWEAGGAPPYWPWLQCLRTCIEDVDIETLEEDLGRGAADVAPIVPEVRERLPHVAPATVADPDAARFRFFEAITAFLRRTAQRRSIVTILDDLHAGDSASLLLLRFLARELAGMGVLVLGGYRSTDVGPELADALSDTIRARGVQDLRLTSLDEPDVGALIASIAGAAPPPAVARIVHEQTEGNPLFVGEVVRLLSAEGGLDRMDAASVRLAVPIGVRQAIRRRVERLSPDCLEILTLGAVIGREFHLTPLERATGLGQAQLLELLDEAAAVGIVTATPASLGRWRFSHVLVRDAVYEEQRPAERASLHGRIGGVLEELYATDPDPHLAELAHHFLLAAPAGDPAKAVDHARRAGERAIAVLAYEEAVRMFEMALEALTLLTSQDVALRADLLLALGDARARAGDSPAAKESFAEGAELARAARMPERLARAALGYGGRFVWEAGRGDPLLARLLEDALETIGDTQDALRARVMARLAGGPLRDDPDRGRRAALSEDAVRIARGLGDPGTLAYALDGRFAAAWWPENLEERLAIAAELIRAATEAGDDERLLQGHHYRLLCLLETGDRAGLYQALEDKARLAEELRQPAQLFYLTVVQTTLALLEGRFVEAEDLLSRAFELGRRVEESNAITSRAIQLFMLRREQARVAEVEAIVDEAARRFPTYFVLRCVLAAVHAELGRRAQAREVFDALARDGFSALHPNDEWLFSACMLADVAASLDDPEQAAVLYELLRPYAERNAVSTPDACTGSVSRSLGVLAAAIGRLDDALMHLGDALAMNEQMGAVPWVARTHLDIGATLLARGAADDRAAAEEHLRAALHEARSIGQAAVEQRAARALSEQGFDVGPVERRVVRAFLFTDIVESTRLLEAIGDASWKELRDWHDRTLRALFAHHGGHEIDHAGDGFFIVFDTASAAIGCAIAIQRALAEHRRIAGFAPHIRLGVHVGEAIEDADGYSGTTVHQAARLAAAAGADEILVSEAVLDADPSVAVTDRREVALKGLSQPVIVASVPWDVSAA